MAKTQYLNYTIALTDAALVLQLQGAVHAGGAVGATIMAPTDAATLYGAPIQENTTAASYPSIRSEWFAGSNNFPRNVRTFDRCNGGWFGICFLFGTTTHYYWRGTFAFVPEARRALRHRDCRRQPGRAPLARWRRVAEFGRSRHRQHDAERESRGLAAPPGLRLQIRQHRAPGAAHSDRERPGGGQRTLGTLLHSRLALRHRAGRHLAHGGRDVAARGRRNSRSTRPGSS
jgi:hypothetical protein